MRTISIGDKVVLKDRAGALLGEVSVQESKHGGWCGTFIPAPGYDHVRDLFVEWTRLVSTQVLKFVPAVEDRILAIGIAAFRDGEPLPVQMVQIYDEGDQIHSCFELVA